MLNEIFDKEQENMKKSIDALKRNFTTIRSGRVNIGIMDNILVSYYGTPTALNQVATVLLSDATTITISPWEKNILKDIEKSIQEANIGVNPNNDGECIKLFFPPMTTEQREKGAKDAKSMGDDTKVAIRNIRKDANNKIKRLEKDKEITEDDSKGAHDKVQEFTDKFSKMADELVKSKQSDLMKV